MKMKIMKTILLAVILFVGMTGNAFSQLSANAEISTQATIVAALTVTMNNNLSFGQVNNGVTATLDPTDARYNTNTSSSAQLGKLTVTGTGGSSVTYSWDDDDLTSGTNTITFTPSVYKTILTTGYGVTEITNGQSDLTINNTTIEGTAVAGTEYFWIGGSIVVSEAHPAGTYTGTFTLTVEYN